MIISRILCWKILFFWKVLLEKPVRTHDLLYVGYMNPIHLVLKKNDEIKMPDQSEGPDHTEGLQAAACSLIRPCEEG